MQQLIQDIKNQTFKTVYLLYGEEAYLRLQYKDKLKAALVAEDDNMNYAYFEGKDIDVGEVIDLAETLPFFADKRVVFVENSSFIEDGNEQLAEYIPNIPESTCLCFISPKADKRTKIFKAIAKVGRVVEFAEQSEETLRRWIIKRMSDEHKRISQAAVSHLLDNTGTDMVNISMEMEKLFCYTLGRDEVTDEDIDAICTVASANRIFEMIGYVSEKKCNKALAIYHELLSLKESPFGVLALIQRQFNIMLQIKELQQMGRGLDVIAGKLKMSPYIVKKYLPQLKVFTSDEMWKVIQNCCQTDTTIKQGNMNPELAVELLIIRASLG
ncbi:MAG: DNA polymerase III subunit delta [Lachnospiraceae bacterium]|nr:DNA polymerase III subunit delta [Lachnospiraceae bacterium]